MAAVSKALTQRAYAKRRGVRLAAVQKAIESGRLSESLTRDRQGRVTAIDPAKADAEWEANTDPSLAPVGAAVSGFQKSRARREELQAEMTEMKLAKMRGELVEAAEVKRTMTDVFTRCRTKLLGIPSRARQQLPHLSTKDVETIESLVREALEDLASEGAKS